MFNLDMVLNTTLKVDGDTFNIDLAFSEEEGRILSDVIINSITRKDGSVCLSPLGDVFFNRLLVTNKKEHNKTIEEHIFAFLTILKKGQVGHESLISILRDAARVFNA